MTYLDKIWEDKYLHLDLRGKKTTALQTVYLTSWNSNICLPCRVHDMG